MLELIRRIRHVFHRHEFEVELDEEIRDHLARKAEAQGSIKQFGNVTRIKEESRAMWNWNIVEQVIQDIRYAFRTMRANPLFTATAALSLALGIGANTAIYSFMDAIMMRALPVQHPEELVVLHWTAQKRPGIVKSINGSARRVGKTGTTSPNFPFAAMDHLAANHDALSTLIAYAYATRVNVIMNNQADVADAEPVSGNYYAGLGVIPAAGRLIAPDDDRAGAPLIAVLSYDYWKKRFAENPAAVGQSILVNNMPITIVGVSAPGFFGLDPAARPDIFFPLHCISRFSLTPADDERDRFFDKHFYWLEMTGRLRPGLTIPQAQTALGAQLRQFAESTVASDKDRESYPELYLEPGSSGLDSLRQQYSKPLRVLMTMVALILTIACANLANLLLARSAARSREMAVRLSLGAGRGRIVRQLLTESVMLAMVGGALGVAFAWWGIQSITWLIANGRDNFTLHAELNWPVLAFTMGLSLAAGLFFGLAPALQATKVDLTPALKAGKSGGSGLHRGWASRLSATRTLVVAQIAMSLLLVIGAGLFVRNLVNLNSIDLGFNRQNLLIFTLNPRQAGYTGDTAAKFFTDVSDNIRRVPGVRSVGLSSFPLVSYYTNSDEVRIPGANLAPGKNYSDLLSVDPDFLNTMQIPILLGRGIETRDLASAGVVVVNQKFASTFFPGESPLGRHFSLRRQTGDFEIVGVSRNAHYNSIQEEQSTVVYIPYTRDIASLSRMFFQVRTAGNPMAMVNPIREIVHHANALVPMTGINTESRVIDQTVGQQRTFAALGSCFAALALLIACVGLYGAMAYAVARRTSEIGIRMALGAKRTVILWTVMREVVMLAAIGLAIGYYAARQTSHWVESFLFGIKPNDAMAIALSIAILFAAALTAGFVPAWRAARIHPMTALRHE
jgi:predicted permease